MDWRKAVLVLLPLALLSCGPPSILGSWKTTIQRIEVDFRFNPDGTLTGTGTIDGESIDLKGTYKIKDEDITIKLNQASANDPLLQIVSQRIVGLSESGRMEWKNENEFLVTGSRRLPLAFERIKD